MSFKTRRACAVIAAGALAVSVGFASPAFAAPNNNSVKKLTKSDANGNVFGYPGLHIADGSIMPGPVGPNPSFTIAALADRFADSMLEPDQRAAEAAAA